MSQVHFILDTAGTAILIVDWIVLQTATYVGVVAMQLMTCNLISDPQERVL